MLVLLMAASMPVMSQLPLGENPGYYGAQYTDQQLYDLMYAAGARTTRSSVSLQFDLQYGMPTFEARLQYPYSTKGMRNNTFFLFASAGPNYSTESTKKTAGGNRSWLPNGIYNPAFNADGSIDTANKWATYVYDVVQSVGPYFSYWEVWNEPDLTNSSDSYNDSTVSKTSWETTEPTPDELLNMYDSLESYVQLCKIANQVVKKYQPNAKICTGGLGYPWFYQWFLRKGGGQWVDVLSFHDYPYFDWCYCAWTGTTCGPAGFHRNSDYAADQMVIMLQNFRQIETNQGATHIPAIMTETNLPRWSYVPSGDMEVFPQNRPWGTDRTQRNFTIKSFAKMIQAGLGLFYFYQTGETADSGTNDGPTGSEIDAMGMYKNLDKATPGTEVMTNNGVAIRTMQTLMGNYKIDATQPTFPSGVDGARFDSAGNKIYVIWAVTTIDTLETASGSFSLPTGVTYKEYLYNGSSPGTVTGTVSLTGDPYILIQVPGANSSVTCNAGSNQTITLPLSSVTLNASGSTVTNSTISSYIWTQVSGPTNASFTNGNTVSATASNLSSGSYTFQVAIKDANNDSCKSTVQVTVNPALQPPVVNAGNSQTITLPTNSATLSGLATDGAGISSYSWSENSGPAGAPGASITNPASASTNVSNLQAGNYVFTLTVMDLNNLTASASVTVTVNPPLQPPVVNAGPPQTITLPTSTASLSGTATDGVSITGYSWSTYATPTGAPAVSFSSSGSPTTGASNLVAGNYVFQLTVIDANNLSASATTSVTVNPAPLPPVVNAGPSQTITFPVSTVALSGSATDGSAITSYLWSEYSGPSGYTFSSAGAATTTVSNLQPGTYIFELTVTDANNLSTSDTLTVTVNPALPQPPVVNAGQAQTITMPTNSVTLSGSAIDNGGISSYLWTAYSIPPGASTPAFVASGSSSTGVSGLVAGSYVFQLTVTDVNNLTGSATVSVTVNPAQPPVINAGTPQTLTYPASSANLSGSATDAAGIASYAWSQNSGPAGATFTESSAASTIVNGLTVGTYVFLLNVTDQDNLSSSATVTVTINPSIPSVNAGASQAITLPIDSVVLTGTATDASGIASYSWSQNSGPAGATFTSANSSSTTVGTLQQGTYVFQLTATNNFNLSASDTVVVTVNPDPTPPTVNAGIDQTITLPVNTVTLSGSATDASGISSFLWTQVSGPNLAGMTNANTAIASVEGLVAGSYIFKLTATDKNNLSAWDTITVAVNNAPLPPVVNAGSNQSITLPVNSATLSGSASDASGINTYAWSEISGPQGAPAASFNNQNSATCTVTNLVAGTYIFQLTAIDNNSLSGSATVSVLVAPANQPPVVSAGSNQTIVLPTNAVSLTGTATDGTGTITTYAWTQLSGPTNATITNASSISASAANLSAGKYVFQLKVTDNNNLSATAADTITVNALPVVSAGSNQTINQPASSATLTGTASDVTGTIITYAWTQVSGPVTATLTNANTISATATNLAAGSYVFKLTVTDNNSLSASATMTVAVNALPVVSAGTNQTINPPITSTTLTGTASDATGTITAYAWTQVSGPSTSTLTNANTISATASALAAGTYVFQLKVTDNNNLSAAATVTIAVNALPVVSAGSNQTINPPATSATLTGTATDATGTITTYAWTQQSGPSTATLTNASKISATASALVSGTYVFQLKVTDNNNLSASATVSVKVNALPVVSAGANQTITLPTSSATLTGTASDATGTITTYAWTQSSGPSTATWTNAGKISATASKLVAGTYVFQLKVTDNNNLSASATVTVKVNALPVVSAGSNQTVTLPTSTATLTGTASDATGTITTYAWTQVSGPGTATFTNANKISASVSKLVAGAYVFQLKVTDNNNLSASATVTVTVAYPPPAVSAGSNQTITLPTSSATLTGTASDATGTITTYAWTESSGPGTATFTNANKISATVSKLVAGTYVFQLKVTDSHGLSASATVTVIVNEPPVANAGANQTITLPTNKATLNGTKSSDPDGTIASYSWTRVSGPSTPTITGNTTSTATISGLVAGVYVYKLTVTDNRGATASATTQVTVNAAKTGSTLNTSQTQDGTISVPDQQPDSASTLPVDKVVLFPNPARGLVNLQLSDSTLGSLYIAVYDMLGRQSIGILTGKTARDFNTTLDVSGLNSGIYVVRILLGESKKTTLKLIKF